LKRVLVATAGHVDHGKTRLVEALTGIDCDRWQEEKDRGITIDLGFAHLTRDDVQLGFVDVPGHERFVHNAVAGLGGIRVMLLVVAADEGVKPQTREHVAICSLLGIDRAVVALTKADLAGEELLELATLDVHDLLAGSPWPEAPILPVSSATGDGIPELESALLSIARDLGDGGAESRPVRLPVDRAFLLKGLGAVVTGSLLSGRLSSQDELELLPAGHRVRVRSLQVHGQDRESAHPGERTSAQLSGVGLEALHRGRQLVTPGAFATSRRLLARARLLPGVEPLAGWRDVRLHLYSSETLGKARSVEGALGPGAEGLIEIRTREPRVAARGDRFVLRRPSPVTTLGGGEVLDPAWRRLPPRSRRALAERLAGNPERALLTWIEVAGEGGRTAEDVGRWLGEDPASIRGALEALAADGKLLSAAGRGAAARWIAPATLQRVRERTQRTLDAYFADNRLASGMPKAEAARRILRGRGRELAETYFGWLAASGVLAVRADEVSPPGRTADLTDEESTLAAAVRQRYQQEGLTPSSPPEIARSLGAKQEIFDGVVGYLLRKGDLVRLPGGLLLSRQAFDELAAQVRAAGWERFDVADFKDRFGLSRKWAIPLLERLDSEGVTRRVGDQRMVRRG
jgi:selenocysteine-specific elongation factor